MKKKLVAAVCLLGSAYSGFLLADNELVSAKLENVMSAHVAASTKETESLDDLMKTMHTESPAYIQIKMQMEQMFPMFDMDVSMADFRLIAVDGDYAITRVSLKMEKVSGPMFQDHVSDQLFVFKQEQGEWKLWQATMLNVDAL